MENCSFTFVRRMRKASLTLRQGESRILHEGNSTEEEKPSILLGSHRIKKLSPRLQSLNSQMLPRRPPVNGPPATSSISPFPICTNEFGEILRVKMDVRKVQRRKAGAWEGPWKARHFVVSLSSIRISWIEQSLRSFSPYFSLTSYCLF